MTFPSMVIFLVLGLFIPGLGSASSTDISIKGKLSIDPDNISGMVITENFMALATDEGTAIQVLARQGNEFIALPRNKITLTPGKDELDIEGLAWQAPYLYAVGSHAKKRKKIKSDASNKQNIKRLTLIHDEPARNQLFQIQLDNRLNARQIKAFSLMPIIQDTPILEPFTALPGKENGIDIEGIAVSENHLYIGFRGPVLRGNLVPILKLTLKDKKFSVKTPKLKLVNLGGLGIRDMVAFEDKLYLLSGPVNNIPNVYHVHVWNGKAHLTPLPYLKTLDRPLGKPEALVVNRLNQESNLLFWVGQDGLKNGGIKLLD
ncbi:hypothetical protein GHNINEIG_00168 [Hydrogenovibrio crunogenus]|uniref:DUF3616 domain-containing protein n=1 Tax=Hydrogenovibrio crunogenus TaxID=39765 RepID=A0A4V1C8J7_9GAMM|nr:DUF3616 domain-containing protein [Hydrogenovibrio crunogenus]QBZ82144.1 hypothetical protein GHNINEIG_00168 [Hydrogenovibrio crunogenus]